MKRRYRNRSAFTLLELLLVAGILVVLTSLGTFAFLGMQKSAYAKAALVEINSLKSQCDAYKLNVGSFPGTLNDLYVAPSGMVQAAWGGPYSRNPIKGDPWGRPYIYSADDVNDRVMITSNGADGQPGTQDDIPGQIGQ